MSAWRPHMGTSCAVTRRCSQRAPVPGWATSFSPSPASRPPRSNAWPNGCPPCSPRPTPACREHSRCAAPVCAASSRTICGGPNCTGRWPTPSPGYACPVAIRYWHPGCATSFQKSGDCSPSCATNPATPPPAVIAAARTIRVASSSAISASTTSAKKPQGKACSTTSCSPACAAIRCWPYSPPAAASQSATSSRHSIATTAMAA